MLPSQKGGEEGSYIVATSILVCADVKKGRHISGTYPNEATRKSKWLSGVTHFRSTAMMNMDVNAPRNPREMSRKEANFAGFSTPPRILHKKTILPQAGFPSCQGLVRRE